MENSGQQMVARLRHAFRFGCAKTLLVAVSGLLIQPSEVSAETNVNRAISQMKGASAGKTPDQMATNFLSLLETFHKPEEQGKIYFTVAQRLGWSGGRRPEQVAAFCQKALEFPLTPADASQACVILGEMFQFQMRSAADEDLPKLRLKALDAFLQGLAVLEKNLNFKERRPRIGIELYDIAFDLNDAEQKAYWEKIRAEQESKVKANAEIDEQNHLLDEKDLLKRKIIDLYSLPPFQDAADEVLTEGSLLVHDKALLEEMVKSIRAAAKPRAGKKEVIP